MENIESIVRGYTPSLIAREDNRQAAVALVLRHLVANPQILFIERARNRNDPWSGQIAFPGGNRDPEDVDVLAAAIRETDEEVGIRLSDSSLIGRMDDQQGRSNFRKIPLIISCFVFHLDSFQSPTNNEEVEDSFWVDLAHIQNPLNRIQYKPMNSDQVYPAVQLDSERVLWGLTYRFVQMFLDTIR